MDTIERARSFFQGNGRDIDKARFEAHFGDLPLAQLLEILRRYQHPDGGFGNGLEVDIAAPDSNPFATDLALQICILAGAPREHEILRRAEAYLEQTQSESGDWRFTENVYAQDLAPWFQAWEWPNLNPACPISGHLKELGLGSEALHARVENLFDRLADPLDLAGDEFYKVNPYALYFLPEWAHPQREFYLSGVLWWLIRQHASVSLPDNGHFFEYIRTPETYTAKHLPEGLISGRLEALAAEQAEDGGWPTPYNNAWRGWVTVQNLLVLRAFGRI
jgi:hypothetical protein